MIAGRLNERVTLLTPSVTTDGFGAETTSYAVSATVHAEVVWKSGGTATQASERFPDGRVEIVIRDAHEVGDKWRVSHAGILYSVSAIEHNRARGLRRLICDRVNE